MVNLIAVSSRYATGQKLQTHGTIYYQNYKETIVKDVHKYAYCNPLCPFVMTLCMREIHLHVFWSRGLLFFHYQEEKKKKKQKRISREKCLPCLQG